MQINEINFINIENLILEENSLAFNTRNYFANLKVNFVNVSRIIILVKGLNTWSPQKTGVGPIYKAKYKY